MLHAGENGCRVPVVSVSPRQQRRSRQAAYRRVGEEVVEACALTSHHVDGERHAEALHQRQVLVVREEKDEVGLLPLRAAWREQQRPQAAKENQPGLTSDHRARQLNGPRPHT